MQTQAPQNLKRHNRVYILCKHGKSALLLKNLLAFYNECRSLIGYATQRNRLNNVTLEVLEVYSLSLHLERSDYCLERSDYLVERSDQRMERSGHGTK